MKNYTKAILKSLLISTSIFVTQVESVKAQTYPTGFTQTLVSANITSPTALAFAPDGRLFVAQQNGSLRIIKNGSLLPTPFIMLNVNSAGERGLLGIAFDPDFSTNQYVYLYYTISTGANNRVSRFTANGDEAVPGSESVLLNLDPLSVNSFHNGGTLGFGPDGKLYIGVGENGTAANAQDLNTNLGKVLRINKDGSLPGDNPFNSGTTQRQSVWSYGLRNPYTIAFDPAAGKLFIDDVGQSTWEEINDGTNGGLNFGWPTEEGFGSVYQNPVYAYSHSNGCAITGGAFYNAAVGNFPAAYDGAYFYLDYCGDWIDYLAFPSGIPVRHTFGSSIPDASVGLICGPDGNLYFTSRTNASVYKIAYGATGITENPDAKSFKMYPQPANDLIHIESADLNSAAEIIISVHALDGKLISNKTIKADKGLSFPVNNLKNGAYLLHLQQGSTDLWEKLTIAR